MRSRPPAGQHSRKGNSFISKKNYPYEDAHHNVGNLTRYLRAETLNKFTCPCMVCWDSEIHLTNRQFIHSSIEPTARPVFLRRKTNLLMSAKKHSAGPMQGKPPKVHAASFVLASNYPYEDAHHNVGNLTRYFRAEN